MTKTLASIPSNLKIGAWPITSDEVQFCVWAPKRKHVSVRILENGIYRSANLQRDEAGYFVGVAKARHGDRYHYELDQDTQRPDPASSFQPLGVHGDSQIIDHNRFEWTDHSWNGIPKRELVIYELHIGSFSKDGTYAGAIQHLDYLSALGITAIELLPVAQAPGRWNWGYDGVNIFAPNHNYGSPDELKHFINECHERGFAVLLDVVYNHLGPEGNYLRDFGPYFSTKYHTPWGEAVNFDGKNNTAVRDYFIANALYWIEQFHFDGLRLDAAHFLFDNSPTPILGSLRDAVSKCEQAAQREIHLIAEANIFDHDLLNPQPDSSGESYDAIWCDCLMHSIYAQGAPDVRLTRRNYLGSNEIAEALTYGFLYRSQPKVYQQPDIRPVRVSEAERNAKPSRPEQHESLVLALQTHDSVGNHPHGLRIHQLTSPEFQMAAAALTLLSPGIPLIFMGEESASESPFPFFVDFEDEYLRNVVDEGRAREYPQHAWEGALSPSDPQAFLTSKLHVDANSDSRVLAWYKQLLKIRRDAIEKGWLSAETLHVTHEVGSDIFKLDYSNEEARSVLSIVSALTTDSEKTHATELKGRVLADSRDQHPIGQTVSVTSLAGPHCIVVQRT